MSRLLPEGLWSETTAVFGGRFDPPHIGHREAVRGLFTTLGVKQVLIIPSAAPPHKQTSTSAEHRAELARINFSAQAEDPYFPQEVELDLRELDRAKRFPGRPSYSFDTLQELKPLYPSLAFAIGTDQLKELHTWYRFPELLRLCHWIVLERKSYPDATALKTLAEWSASGLVEPTTRQGHWKIRQSSFGLNLVPTDAPSVSSTQIRESLSLQEIRSSNPPQLPDVILPSVYTYLKKNKLYGTSV